MTTPNLETKVDEFLAQKRIDERLVKGRRVLPSKRHQGDRWCLPDDVRPRGRPRTYLYAVVPQGHRRTTEVGRKP
jgi:hypothetical protein